MTQLTIPDTVLRQAVLKALASDKKTSSLNLRVGVHNALVHLGGEAPSEEIWHLAEILAADVAGVQGVVNRIAAPGAPKPQRVITLQPREK